ncbi:RNA ligase family protein [Dyadobacter aurulentus]|uniref:RNA ligase family protein n=1 Tax=Dyadobacter sp. UC 10 TaxID=2605428 RepID=UPI001788DB79|nr:RNA ligase family protein [Dyadobacter sp. UC 10]
MQHTLEYEKIPSSLKELITDEAAFKQFNKLTWVATEKIHGANFRFIYHDKSLLFGKRKELLTWKDDFFGFQIVAAALEERVVHLFETIVKDYQTKNVILYGELFGGLYPHEQVAINKDVEAVQSGIFYSPNIDFCAYDIAFENPSNNRKVYVSYQNALGYFERFDIFHAKPLQTGKLSDLLNITLCFETRIPAQLHLPSIENNLAEGVVIKPFSDHSPEAASRPILKLKNPEFEENRKFHQARKWSFIPDVTSISQDLDFLLQDLFQYVTANRLNNVISKIGKPNSDERWKQIEQEFLEDVFTEFNNCNDHILSEVTPTQHQWISDRLKAEIRRLPNF